MITTLIDVSNAPDSRLFLRVLAVDFELRLFQDQAEVFDARLIPTPKVQPLNRRSTYVLRYNNNDGGPGVLHFQVVEARNVEVVRHEVNLDAIQSPEVDEFVFAFQPSPALSVPA
jgi:hypothetical protein